MPNIKRANTSGITKSGVAIPDVPDAPTIGTATNVGTARAFNNGSATVAFTANPRGGTSTSFTATSTPGGFTATGAGSPLTVTGLQSATSYTFAVTGTNTSATGAASAASNSITATTVPATMTAPTATAGDGTASVAFTAPATGGSAIIDYTVTSSSGLTATGGSSPLVITETVAGTRTYTVTARNANGSSTASSASNSLVFSVPAAPTIGTATLAGGQAFTGSASISVPFTANATGNAAITSYTVTSSSTATGSGSASPISVSETVGNPTSTARTYTVRATNKFGTSSASAASNSIAAVSVPQAPTIGAVTGGNASATVAYTANATGGAAVSTFTATSSPGGFTGTGASPITVSGLTNGTAYTFTVTASNANGTSGASGASNSVTPVVPNFLNLTGSGITTFGSSGGVVNPSNGQSSAVGYLNTGGGSTMATASYNSSGTIQWQLGLNATTSSGRASAIDSSGNIYSVGSITISGYSSLVVVKYNPSGTILWQRTVDRANNAISYFPATAEVGPDDGIVISLITPTPFTCNLIKFNASGSMVYAKDYQVGAGNRDQWITGIDFDPSGNIYLSSFGRGSLSTNTNQGFVHRFDPTFTTQQWATLIEYSNIYEKPNSIFVDSSSNTYTTLDVGSPAGVSLVKLNSSGAKLWERLITAGYSVDNYNSIAEDSSGFIYLLTGNQNNSGVSGKGQANIFKYDTNGNLQWQRSLTISVDSLQMGSIRIVGSNIYLTGHRISSVSPAGFLTVTLPTDGSKTGSYTNSGLTFTYAASSFTDSAGTASIGSTGNTKSPGDYTPTIVNSTFGSNTLSYTSTTTSF